MASGEWRVASGECELGGLPRVAGRPAARWAERAERSWAAGTMRLSARVRRRSLALAGARRRSPALHGATCGRRFDLSGRRFGFSVQSSYLGEILVEILLGSHPETASAPRSGKRAENESVGRGFGALEPNGEARAGPEALLPAFALRRRYFVRLSSTNGRVAPSASRTCTWKARTSGRLKWFTGSPSLTTVN